jgi:hypothetical protein
MDFKPLITITINNNYATDRACQQSLDQRELESSPISRREGIRPGRHILHVDVVPCGGRHTGTGVGRHTWRTRSLPLSNKSQESERTERESRTHPTPEMYVNDVAVFLYPPMCSTHAEMI